MPADSSRRALLRLIGPFAAMIVLTVGISGAIVYLAGQRNVRGQQIEDLRRTCVLVRQLIDDSAAPEAHGDQLHKLSDTLQTRITLIDADGHVRFDTHHDPATMVNHNDRPEVIQARRDGSGSSVRPSDTINEMSVYVALPLDPAKPDGIVLRVSYPQHVWTKLAVPVWSIIVAATVAALLMTLWLGLELGRRWIGPVRNLGLAAEQLTAGLWTARAPVAGAPEVQLLAKRFNHMADQTQQQVAQLQALVDSLPDPIVLGDEHDRVVVVNAPAARLLELKLPQALGRPIQQLIVHEPILRLIEQLKSGGEPLIREIRLARTGGGRVALEAVAKRSQAGGVLLVLHDLSAMAGAAQMKTDFVANASHELRTPIAAIKAAFETLRDVFDEDPDQSRRCIAIIDGHMNRLEEMLADLLDLSRVESPDLKPQIQPLEVEQVFAYVRMTLGTMARNKGVDLVFVADGFNGERSFLTDPRLLKLVLKNLVENGLKFTAAGGSVTVRLSRNSPSGAIALDVIDTGIGVPLEHQQRVFERFYQVDPARSGAGRGTGLGLAIVKHAIHALGGTVQLNSAVGVGTTVTCTLPRQIDVEAVVEEVR